MRFLNNCDYFNTVFSSKNNKLFLEALRDGDIESARNYLSDDLKADFIDVLLDDISKWRPIHVACKRGHKDIVLLLIENKCDIECEDRYKRRPIHIASRNMHHCIVELLIENKCSIECEDKDSWRPIHIVCMNGSIEIVNLLIKCGCNIDCANKNNMKPICLAQVYGNNAIVEILNINHGENLIVDEISRVISRFETHCWYSAEEIIKLLEHISDNHYIVCKKTGQSLKNLDETIKSAVEDVERMDVSNKIIVVPLNISPFFTVNHVPQWIGIVICMNPNGELNATYVDSLGYSVNDSVLATLINNNIQIVLNQSKRQHHILNDCGSWTVFNLDRLAKTGQLPDDINAEKIANQRSTLKIILKKESCFQGASDIRTRDLQNVDEMMEVISEFELKVIKLEDALEKIGRLSSRISSTYDEGDGASVGIRNKYGCILQKEGEGINEDKIFFEKLSYLEKFCNDKSFCQSISSSTRETLGKDLCSLKQKIAQILKLENYVCKGWDYLNSLNFDLPASIDHIINFSIKYYRIFLLKSIKIEVDKVEDVDFKERLDRYYFARVFCKISDSLQLVLQDEGNESCPISRSFKNVVSIGNQIVRSGNKVIFYGSSTRNDRVTELVRRIVDHLRAVICEQSNAGEPFTINNQYLKGNEFLQDTESLLKALKEIEDYSSLDNRKDALGEAKCTEEIKSQTGLGTVIGHLQVIDNECRYFLSIIEDVTKKFQQIDCNQGDLEDIIQLTKGINDFFDYGKFCFLFGKYYLVLSQRIETLRERDSRMTKYGYIFDHVMMVIGLKVGAIETLGIGHLVKSSRFKEGSSMRSGFHGILKCDIIWEQRMSFKISENIDLSHYLYVNNKEMFYETLVRLLNQNSVCESYNRIRNNKTFTFKDLLATALSLYEHELYDQTIECIEECHRQLECGSCEIEKNELDQECLAIFGKSHFSLTMDRLKISSHFCSGSISRVCIELEDVMSSVDWNLVDKCNHLEIKYHASFLLRIKAFCMLSRNDDYNGAIQSLVQAIAYYESVPVLHDLALVYFDQGDYEKYQQIFGYIFLKYGNCDNLESANEIKTHGVRSSDLEISQVSSVFAKLSSDFMTRLELEVIDLLMTNEPNLCTDIDQLESCILATEHFMDETGSHNRNEYRDIWISYKIRLLDCRIATVFRDGFRDTNEEKLSELVTIDEELQNILDRHNVDQSDPLVNKFYLRLCRGYCSVFKKENVDLYRGGECLERAKIIFPMATGQEIQDSLHKCGDYNTLYRVYVRLTAKHLVIAHNEYYKVTYSQMDLKSRLEFISEYLKLSSRFDMTDGDGVILFALQHFNLANTYYTSSKENFVEEYSLSAVTNFLDALASIKLGLRDLANLGEYNSLRVGRSQYIIPWCNYCIGYLTYDYRLLRDSSIQLNDLVSSLAAKLTEMEQVLLRLRCVEFQSTCDQITSVLKCILDTRCLSDDGEMKLDKYAFEYCKRRWDIVISYDNRHLTWTYEGDLTIEELKEAIREELH